MTSQSDLGAAGTTIVYSNIRHSMQETLIRLTQEFGLHNAAAICDQFLLASIHIMLEAGCPRETVLCNVFEASGSPEEAEYSDGQILH